LVFIVGYRVGQECLPVCGCAGLALAADVAVSVAVGGCLRCCAGKAQAERSATV